MQPKDYLTSVREQYENYPYPMRAPEDEYKRILPTTSFLDHVNHYCFEGKQTFNNNFRVLIAGGGTGDTTIFVAEQLRDKNAEVVHLDISQSSLKIAQQRASIRQLKNIRFVHASILDIASLDIGKFDYIECSGVLHHLKVPADGLKMLKFALKEDGAINIMIYGKYGRLGVTVMQELMRKVNYQEQEMQKKVDNCKIVFNSLKDNHIIKWNAVQFSEVKEGNDIGIYDLFLHSQEKCYTVPEIYQWVEEECGLKIGMFYNWATLSNDLYTVEQYITEPNLLATIKKLPIAEQTAIAELMSPYVYKHNVFITKVTKKVPQVSDQDYVPFYASRFEAAKIQQSLQGQVPAISNVAFGENVTFNFDFNVIKRSFSVKNSKFLVHLINTVDGKRSVKEIISVIKNKLTNESQQVSEQEILISLEQFYHHLNHAGFMFLRAKEAPLFRDSEFYQSQFLKNLATEYA